MQKFIQITDCHLFATDEGKLLGMDTQASLEAVMDKIHSEQDNYDFYLCTGDLSQDGSIESYQYLKDLLDKDGKEQFWIPGNHDYRPNMLEVVSENKEMLPVIKKGNWQFILMDSQVPGSVFGNFSQGQLDMLESALEADSSTHTLITMHHHPKPMGCKWLDTQQIRNSQALLDIIAKYDNVRVVLWGHVHQDSDNMVEGVRFISTPSTCVQFTPESSDFDVDKETGVSRVEHIDFKIDYTTKGY